MVLCDLQLHVEPTPFDLQQAGHAPRGVSDQSLDEGMTINTSIRPNDAVPVALWGRDHWSTLAYIETKLVDDDGKDECGYSVRFDPRMRQCRRHFRVLSEALPGHRKREAQFGEPMQPTHGSRLSDGTYLPWHDDWHCVQDLMAEGLFEHGEWDAGMELKLTELGHEVAAALRKHKAAGGTYSDCNALLEAVILA